MFDTEGTDLLSQARLQALGRDYVSALRTFQRAFQDKAFEGDIAVHPQSLSHYGVTLAVASERREEGLRLCERSIQLEPYEAEHYLNLARIHVVAGNRAAAFGALDRGLSVSPEHPLLLHERGSLDRRRFLFFSSLPREHPLNRCVGRLLRATGHVGQS